MIEGTVEDSFEGKMIILNATYALPQLYFLLTLF